MMCMKMRLLRSLLVRLYKLVAGKAERLEIGYGHGAAAGEGLFEIGLPIPVAGEPRDAPPPVMRRIQHPHVLPGAFAPAPAAPVDLIFYRLRNRHGNQLLSDICFILIRRY
jgi:hypothetical protein